MNRKILVTLKSDRTHTVSSIVRSMSIGTNVKMLMNGYMVLLLFV
jgi:hypothetical protein